MDLMRKRPRFKKKHWNHPLRLMWALISSHLHAWTECVSQKMLNYSIKLQCVSLWWVWFVNRKELPYSSMLPVVSYAQNLSRKTQNADGAQREITKMQRCEIDRIRLCFTPRLFSVYHLWSEGLGLQGQDTAYDKCDPQLEGFPDKSPHTHTSASKAGKVYRGFIRIPSLSLPPSTAQTPKTSLHINPKLPVSERRQTTQMVCAESCFQRPGATYTASQTCILSQSFTDMEQHQCEGK